MYAYIFYIYACICIYMYIKPKPYFLFFFLTDSSCLVVFFLLKYMILLSDYCKKYQAGVRFFKKTERSKLYRAIYAIA